MNTIKNHVIEPPPEDIAAEGMWRIAAGESCKERWRSLPEDQKEWWRRCAAQALKEWIANLYQGLR